MEAEDVYHEKQELYRCGIHALNGVLQARVFDNATMEHACAQLAVLGDPIPPSRTKALWNWAWNPHKSPLGLGNYDVNVLMYVLEEKGYKMQWMDKRRRISKETLDLDAMEGILCNVIMANFFRSVWEQRHWFAIRKINGVCYNLDSKLPGPVAFDSEGDCYQFLQELVDTGECELFSVTKSIEAERE